jgi:hypothetical protein
MTVRSRRTCRSGPPSSIVSDCQEGLAVGCPGRFAGQAMRVRDALYPQEANSPAKPPALPERIEVVLQLRE